MKSLTTPSIPYHDTNKVLNNVLQWQKIHLTRFSRQSKRESISPKKADHHQSIGTKVFNHNLKTPKSFPIQTNYYFTAKEPLSTSNRIPDLQTRIKAKHSILLLKTSMKQVSKISTALSAAPSFFYETVFGSIKVEDSISRMNTNRSLSPVYSKDKIKKIIIISEAICENAFRKAGHDPKTGIQTSGHIFITHSLDHGTDERYTKVLLGQSSSKTTENYTYESVNSTTKMKSPLFIEINYMKHTHRYKECISIIKNMHPLSQGF